MLRALVRHWRLSLTLAIAACVLICALILFTFRVLRPVRIGARKYEILFTPTLEPDYVRDNIPHGGWRWTESGPPPYYDDVLSYRLGSSRIVLHIYNSER